MSKYLILLSFLLVSCNSYKSDQCYSDKNSGIYSRILDIDSDSSGDWVHYEYADTRSESSDESVGHRSRLISGSFFEENNFDGLYSQKVDCKEFYMNRGLLLVKKEVSGLHSDLNSLKYKVEDLQDRVNKKKK